jgi:hypothetical protein
VADSFAAGADPPIIQSARDILAAAEAAHVPLRLLGGAAVYLRCASARVPPLARAYGDLDFMTTSKTRKQMDRVFDAVGFVGDNGFNRLHGHHRLIFHHAETGAKVDVFVDTFRMCHTLDIRKRLEIDRWTLTLADLLLSKLQIIEVNEKDIKDAAAIFADFPPAESDEGINAHYITRLMADDWGFQHTLEKNLVAIEHHVPEVAADCRTAILSRIEELRARLVGAPKSFKWKTRARVGERMAWYQLPEEPTADEG